MGKSFIDMETGEIMELMFWRTDQQQHQITEYKKQKQRKEKLYEMIRQHSGAFFFYRYDKLLEQLDDDTEVGFRFLYLCSKANPDGTITAYENRLCKTIEDFTYVFDKTISTVSKYMNTMINNKLIYKDGGVYRINPLYYYTKLDNSNKYNSIRTFNKAIQELYNNSNPKEHKLMGQLIKLTPYINIHNNILCWNPEETNIDLIVPLSSKDIQNIFKPDSNYGYELFHKFEKVYIKGEPVMGIFRAVGEVHYVINPRVFYRGNDYKELQSLIDQFDIAKYQAAKTTRRKMTITKE